MTTSQEARPSVPRREGTLTAIAEELFGELTRLAEGICGSPLVAITLSEDGQHWFQSRGGAGALETSCAMALCAKTVALGEPLVVPDLSGDERFGGDVFAGSGVRFFAGVPVISDGRTAVGAFCVMDRAPRHLQGSQLEALRELGQRFARRRAAAELPSRRSSEGAVVYDRAFRHTFWSPFMERLTGLSAEAVLGRGILEVFPQFRDQGVFALLERAAEGETVSSPDVALPVPDSGARRWISATFAPHREPDGRIRGVVARIRDVTDRRKTEESFMAAAPGLRCLVEGSHAGIYLIQDERYRYVNPRLATILGHTPEELLALESAASAAAPEDRETVLDHVGRLLRGELPAARYGFTAVKRDGERVEVEVHESAAEFEGRPAIAGVLLDVTDRKRSEAQIVEQAHHDPLTRLPNRIRFMQQLLNELEQARRHGRKLALVFLDVDHFKLVNDNWGHGAGDALLKSLALRLTRHLRQVDTVARVGGDEFVILMPDVRKAEDMTGVAQKLLSLSRRPFELEGRTLQVTTSIGVATYPDDGEDAEVLLRNADAAMYRAKDVGRNTFQLCTPELTARAVERLELQSGLQIALDEKRFVLHYQPLVSLRSGRTVGLEALVRWQDPRRGLVMPGAFIPVAEESGLIVPLGDWVLESACRQLGAWQRARVPDLRMAVNVSARHFREPGLVHSVERALTAGAVEPQHLEIEITESIAMEGAGVVVANLSMLRSMGVGIAIDDFGTGYSSLSYLKTYPATSLKIDRSFVTDVATNPADAGIVRAIIEMAHGSRLNVVAEGVETKEQFERLSEYGCDEMQGFWIRRPMPVEGIDEHLAAELELWAPRA